MGFMDLIARIAFDGSAFEAGLRKSTAAVDKFGAAVSSRMKGALGAAFGVGALTVAGKSVIDYGSKINDLAMRLGVSTDALQEWDYALTQNSGTLEDAVGFFEKLNVARAKALDGDKKLTASFREFGVTLDDLKSKRVEDIARSIGEVFKAGGDPQRFIDSLKEIGGKSSGAMIATLASGFKEAAEEARKLGLVIENGTIKRLDEAGDKLDQAKKRWRMATAEPAATAVAGGASWFEGIQGLGGLLGATSAAKRKPFIASRADVDSGNTFLQFGKEERAEYVRKLNEAKRAESEAKTAREKRTAAAALANAEREFEAAKAAVQDAELREEMKRADELGKQREKIAKLEFDRLDKDEQRESLKAKLARDFQEFGPLGLIEDEATRNAANIRRMELEAAIKQLEEKGMDTSSIDRQRLDQNFSALDRMGLHGLGMNNPVVEINKKQLDALLKVVNNTDPAKLKFPLI